MKKGIFVALAALAFAVFTVPDAHAWKGHHNRPDIDLHAWGANLISSDEGGIPTPLNTVPVTALPEWKDKREREPFFVWVNVTPSIRPRVGPD